MFTESYNYAWSNAREYANFRFPIKNSGESCPYMEQEFYKKSFLYN